MGKKKGSGGGAPGGGSAGDKTEAFFASIMSETIKTLHWSLRFGGFSPTKPYEEESQLPPIHLAVEHRKLKSLKCMLEVIDRTRDFSALIDYRDEEEGLTPLMRAARNNWKDGVFELVRAEASLTAKCDKGFTAIEHAKMAKASKVISFFEEWLKEDDGPEEETAAMARKREDIEKQKAVRAEKAAQDEIAGKQAKASKIDEHYDLKANQAEAAALSRWDVVREALEGLSAECRIDRADEDADDVKDIDPTLWNCLTLKILRIRMPKTHLTSIPSGLGHLTNLTELIVGNNSLTCLPKEIGKLVHLKALEAEANELASLPDEIQNCTSLEVVNVTKNNLTSLAPLKPLTKLLSILASHNELTDLDIELETKVHLQVLAVSHNQITELPAGVGKLQLMRELDASSNLLEDLPSEMSSLSEKKLLVMRLDDNKFKDRKIKSILEKSVKPVKELTNHLASRGDGGGGGKKGKKKK